MKLYPNQGVKLKNSCDLGTQFYNDCLALSGEVCVKQVKPTSMQLLLAILLYLQFIVSPATYNESYIYLLEEQHQPEINAVHSDPAQMEIVNQEYMEPASQIVIIEDMDND